MASPEETSNKQETSEELVDLTKDLDKLSSQENPKDTVEQVEYNLSSFKIVHIANLMEKSDRLELGGFIVPAFRSYVCVYRHIRSRLTPSEKSLAMSLRLLFLKKRFDVSKEDMGFIQGEYYEKFVNHIQSMLKKYGFDMKQKSKKDHLV